MTIRIHGDRIAGVGTAPELAQEAHRVELDGAVVLPGLIDAHVHLTLDPSIRSPDEQLVVPSDEVVRAMEVRALRMVRAGVTTARDLGGGRWLEFNLRDRILSGEIPGPRLLCAGQPVTTPTGHCHFWGGGAGSEEEIRQVVRRQIDRGTDWVKVMASGGVMTRESRASDAQFDAVSMGIVLEEANRGGRPVAAHCHATSAIRIASQAGVRTVEHCSWSSPEGFGTALDREVLRDMARRELWISATVNPGWGRRYDEQGRPTPFVHRMRACFEAARQECVPLIASTDAGIPGVEHDALPEALPVFAGYAGFEPVEALRAATSESANALGLGKDTGRVEVGFRADLLAVGGDPVMDLSALRDVRCVVAAGQKALETPSAENSGRL
ncbi:amidohydrolase family protein [Myxococcota bacterium]|nr:amidohydrolase family protein [Myxococcota bacterium]